MAGKIFRYDCYDLRKYKVGDIYGFLDIGANNGTTSLMAKLLNPTARVIALEPVRETFEILEANMKQWIKAGIECHNVALGDGTPMCFHDRGRSGMHRFYTDQEKHLWPKDFKYTIESKSLASIFEDYKISTADPYIIKIDCEGGERFLLQEEETLDIVRGSVQTMLEIHFAFGGTGEQWKLWFKKLKDTHELRIGEWKDKKTPAQRYVYTPCDELPFDRGFHQLELVNRKWIGPWPGRGI